MPEILRNKFVLLIIATQTSKRKMERWKQCVQSLEKSFIGKFWALVVLPK